MNLKPTFKHESSHKVILERYSVRLVPPYVNCNVYGLIEDGKPFLIEMAKAQEWYSSRFYRKRILYISINHSI